VRTGSLATWAYVDSDSKALTPAEIEEYLAKLDLDGMAKK
jgi:hypothetical protein